PAMPGFPCATPPERVGGTCFDGPASCAWNERGSFPLLAFRQDLKRKALLKGSIPFAGAGRASRSVSVFRSRLWAGCLGGCWPHPREWFVPCAPARQLLFAVAQDRCVLKKWRVLSQWSRNQEPLEAWGSDGPQFVESPSSPAVQDANRVRATQISSRYASGRTSDGFGNCTILARAYSPAGLPFVRSALCTMPACRSALRKGIPMPPSAAVRLLRKIRSRRPLSLKRWEKNRNPFRLSSWTDKPSMDGSNITIRIWCG